MWDEGKRQITIGDEVLPCPIDCFTNTLFQYIRDYGILRYVVVNTRNWLPGKKVLVSP